MIKSINLIDYDGNRHSVNVDMDGVQRIILEIHSGDEVLRLYKLDGTDEVIDPMKDKRFDDYPQGSYPIYEAGKGDLTNNLEWLDRRSPESWLLKLFEKRTHR